MKAKISVLAMMLVAFLFSLNLATEAVAKDEYQLAKENETAGDFNAAANNYYYASVNARDLSRKAQIHVDLVRVNLKRNNVGFALGQMEEVRRNEPKKYLKMLAGFEAQTRKLLVADTSGNRYFGGPSESIRNAQIMRFHQFFPNSGKALADDFYKMGVKEKGTEGEEYWFTLAAAAHKDMGAKIAKESAAKMKTLPLEQQIPEIINSAKYWPSNAVREAKAKELLVLGKDLAKKPGEEVRVDNIRKAMTALMGSGWVEENLPETVVYGPGEYIFKLAISEQTVHWIAYQAGRETNYEIASLPGSDFDKKYDDGTIIGMNESHEGSLSKMKFVARQDSTIRLRVK